MSQMLSSLWETNGQDIEIIKTGQVVTALVKNNTKDEQFKHGTRLDAQDYRLIFLSDVNLVDGDKVLYLNKHYKVRRYRQIITFKESYWQAEVEEVIQTKRGSFYD